MNNDDDRSKRPFASIFNLFGLFGTVYSANGDPDNPNSKCPPPVVKKPKCVPITKSNSNSEKGRGDSAKLGESSNTNDSGGHDSGHTLGKEKKVCKPKSGDKGSGLSGDGAASVSGTTSGDGSGADAGAGAGGGGWGGTGGGGGGTGAGGGSGAGSGAGKNGGTGGGAGSGAGNDGGAGGGAGSGAGKGGSAGGGAGTGGGAYGAGGVGTGDGAGGAVGAGTGGGAGGAGGAGSGAGPGTGRGAGAGPEAGAGDGNLRSEGGGKLGDGQPVGDGDDSMLGKGLGDGSKGVGLGDRGITGAGVAGSRDPQTDPQLQADELPASAHQPGLLRHIHNAARLRIPQCFEGASVSVKKYIYGNWLVGHLFQFSSVSPSGYKFLLSYAEKNKKSGLPYFILEAAPGGQMSCEVRVRPTFGTRASVVAQVADRELYGLESTLDIFFGSFTTSLIAVNREFIALHFLQSITNRLSLGAEVVARGYKETEFSSASAAARWASDHVSLSATLGNRGLDLCFAKVMRPHLTVAGMLEVGFAVKRAVGTLAYEWHTEDYVVKASADSDGLVGATLIRTLGGTRADLSCAVSALLNHPNDKFRLGFCVNATIK